MKEIDDLEKLQEETTLTTAQEEVLKLRGSQIRKIYIRQGHRRLSGESGR